jgi:hypothetical protein
MAWAMWGAGQGISRQVRTAGWLRIGVDVGLNFILEMNSDAELEVRPLMVPDAKSILPAPS